MPNGDMEGDSRWLQGTEAVDPENALVMWPRGRGPLSSVASKVSTWCLINSRHVS